MQFCAFDNNCKTNLQRDAFSRKLWELHLKKIEKVFSFRLFFKNYDDRLVRILCLCQVSTAWMIFVWNWIFSRLLLWSPFVSSKVVHLKDISSHIIDLKPAFKVALYILPNYHILVKEKQWDLFFTLCTLKSLNNCSMALLRILCMWLFT